MQPSRQNQGRGMLLLGTLIGLLVGGGIGVWRAPSSGKELRQRLLQQGVALGSKAEEMVAGERVSDAVAEGKALAQQRQKEMSHQ